MSNFKNEKGAALVLTLLIITLILLVILTQFTQISNTTRQVATMEENIDTRLIAEMGVAYYEQVMDEKRDHIEEILNTSGEDALLTEISNIDSSINKKVIIDEEKNRSFTIEPDPPQINEQKEIVIEFKSIGEASKKVEEIESKIVITISDEHESEESQ